MIAAHTHTHTHTHLLLQLLDGLARACDERMRLCEVAQLHVKLRQDVDVGHVKVLCSAHGAGAACRQRVRHCLLQMRVPICQSLAVSIE